MRSEKGVAVIEYVLIVPLLLLLFLGSLEIVRLFSIKQSLRTGLKQAMPCLSHWHDVASRPMCDPLPRIEAELRKNPFARGIYSLQLVPNPNDWSDPHYTGRVPDIGEILQVRAIAEVQFGFLYPFPGGPTITLEESVWTYMDTSPKFLKLNPLTPLPADPGDY
jgi:hypothetical protein